GRDVGCEPESENEVVVLTAKLEALGCLPLANFRLLEYTARRGVDALADFQVNPEDAPVCCAPVEFELYFENFESHDHPIGQVALVVCWRFRSDVTRDRRCLSRYRDGLYQFQLDERRCWVLVLAETLGC
ncbi:hypothetical protein D6833_04745, partial [Candidatus Parcubacteria bacterium]